jgi:hypothetical protein
MTIKHPIGTYTPGMSFDEWSKVVRIVPCPRSCHGGRRGMDNCNTCGCTGSGIRYGGKFYPNTEEGFRDAFKVYSA